MIRMLKTSFVWQFAGGFVLGAVALLALHPAEAGSRFAAAPTAQSALQ